MSAAMLSFVPGPVDPALLVAPSYSAPLLIDAAAITANGSNIFEGNWENTSYSDNAGAAIQVTTTQPVIIRNSRFKAQKYCITSLVNGSDITVENCIGLVRCVNEAGRSAQRFLNVGQPKNLVCEHNTIVGGGILLDSTATGGTLLVRVRYNRMLNTDGRKSDGAGGYVFERENNVNGGYWESIQFIQHRNIVVNDGEVAWNEVVEAPFVCRSEDNFTFYSGSGISSKRIAVHDNCTRGGHSTRPYDLGYSGAGCLAEGTSAYIDFDDNHIIGHGNIALHISGGNYISARRNRYVSCGRIRGRLWYALNAGASYAGNGTSTNIVFEDNGYSWVGPGGSQVSISMPISGSNGNSHTGSYSIASPTTEATEAAEWALWRAKVAAAGVRIGSTLAV